MSPGRAPSWNVVASVEPTSWLESMSLSSDERLLLPAELRKRVSWASPKRSLPLLAVIQADGAVVVAPLADRSGEIDAVRSALEAAPSAARASLAFAAMALYARVSLQPDGRLRLSPGLARQLAGRGDEPVWAGAHGDRVWLWSDEAWRNALSSGADALRQAIGASTTAA